MIITREVIDQIMRKNGRARRKMARRYLRKVGRRIGLKTRYTPLELEIQPLTRPLWYERYREKERKRRGPENDKAWRALSHAGQPEKIDPPEAGKEPTCG